MSEKEKKRKRRGKKSTKKKNFSFPEKRKILPPLFIILVLSLLYLLRGQFVVAVVNGKPIFRLTLIRELEKQGGKTTLDSLITTTLVLQAAEKEKINISQEEINQEIGKIEKTLNQQNQNLDQALASQGMTKDDLINQIKVRMIAEKLGGKDVKVSDEEVDQYFEKNKDSLASLGSDDQAKSYIKEQLKQQKMNKAIQAWVTKLRQEAKISYFASF